MRSSIALALTLVLATPALAQETPWVRQKLDVRIKLRDGKSLAADVHLPPRPGRYPVVVIQTPYGKRHHGRPQPGAAGDQPARGLYDRDNYAYLVVDWRGFHGSRSARVRGRPTLGRDGYDVVEWAAKQPWSNGRIGTWGPSALGKVQFETAAEQPPHLVCSVPLVAGYGHRYEDYFEGGVLLEQHLADLDRLGFGTSRMVGRATLSSAPIYRIAKRLERYEKIDVPMLIVTGWYDHGTRRQLATYDLLLRTGGPRARTGSRLLVGPWHHTALDQETQGDLTFPDAVGEVERESRAFFDHHLRGLPDTGWAERPRVRVWRINEKGWHGGSAWPAAVEQVMTLHDDGSIAAAAPGEDEGARRYVADPRDATPTVGGANLPISLLPGPRDQARIAGRNDVLVYTTAKLRRPIRIDGEIRVTVHLRCDRPDTDLAIRLCDVQPDGTPMLVADGIRRAQLRTSTSKPRLIEKGKIVEVTVTLPPLAITFPPGHRLCLLVSGSNWPRYERNTHTGALRFDEAAAVPAKVEILHDAAHPSRVVLPVLPLPAGPR